MVKRIPLITMLTLFFQLTFAVNPTTQIHITTPTTTVAGYQDKEVLISGKSELHITSPFCKSALVNSIVRLNSEDAWLFFDNIRPSVAIDSLLQYVYVGQNPAVDSLNVRVTIYKHGVVIIPHTPGFTPLTVFTGQGLTGDSASYGLFTYNTNLGAMDNKIRSIKLRRGYMATLAANSDGGGYSRVFIADDKDIEISNLGIYLDEQTSFIRVFPWEYVTKKGWCGTGSGGTLDVEKVKGTWWYSWSASGESTQNQEYVPIRQTSVWPGWDQINSKKHVTHLLGFNEPNRPDQANMTVQAALALWPEFMRSGLRLGSPSPSDPFGSNGDWLYSFLDSCKVRNYRVDYIAIHCYWGGKSAQQWYNDLKNVHQRTGLPIWITEWNNGANWTNEWWPDASKALTDANAAKQLNDLKGILNVLDTASFVERYSIYNWVQDCRAMILNDVFTPAGVYYRENKSTMAFNNKKQVVPAYRFNRNMNLDVSFVSEKVEFTVRDFEPNYYRGFILEKKIGDGEYAQVFNTDNRLLKTCSDDIDVTLGVVKYRVKAKLADGSYSNYSGEYTLDVTKGENNMQFGNLKVSNLDWNPVLFNQAFQENPSIILGSPTYNNTGVRMSPRVRFIDKNSRFLVNASAWSYQNATSISKEETIPYFALAPGSYDFGGGVKVLAGSTNAISSWISVTFPTPFDSVPVVFVNQVNSPTSYATSVRVKDITNIGFKLRITKEGGVTSTPGLDKISYIAITTGKGVYNNRKIIVGRTAPDFVTTSPKIINYGDTVADPVFIAQMQTTNDDITAALRSYLVKDQAAIIFKQRENSTSTATTAAETAGWIIIDPIANAPQSIYSPKMELLHFSPNPVTDKIIFQHQEINGSTVTIYNLSGIVVKAQVVQNSTIDVSDLAPGYYVMQNKGIGSKQFVKLVVN